tara:strand:- start:28298 stop:28939 length:642 start_codon:yes stop_codon:yes gene_type:complete
MTKLLLDDYSRYKMDNNPDTLFYLQPKLVYHLDKSFRNRLTTLYKNTIKENTIVLDLMSSWVSHLPDIKYKKIIGHGLNEYELKKNKYLDYYWIQDLNVSQNIKLDENSIDYCLIVAGWQYLQYPEKVASEIYRILNPGGNIIVSFTNRAFWNKSPNIWVNSSEKERTIFVCNVLKAQGFKIKKIINEVKDEINLFKIFGINQDPFYSIIAEK